MTIRSITLTFSMCAVVTLANGVQSEDRVRFVPVDDGHKSNAFACARRSALWVLARETPVQRIEYDVSTSEPQVGAESHGLDLPFDPGPAFDMEGVWVSERIDDGWLVGLTRGEWGGGLWYIREGVDPLQLLDRRPVHAVGMLDRPYAVVDDLDPATNLPATAIMMLGREGGDWQAVGSWRMKGSFVAIHDTGRNDMYVLSYSRLARVTGEGISMLASSLDGISELGPFTFAANENQVSVGMRMMMLQADLHGDASYRWLIPSQCRETRVMPVVVSHFGSSVEVERCECIAED